MAGGTWKIVVEEGATKSPTQTSITTSAKKPTTPKIASEKNKTANISGKRVVQTSLLVGAAAARTGFNQYYSITGQGGQRNRMNATLTYGAAVASIGIQVATGNFVGAAVTTIGTGLALGNQYVNFQREIADQNAMAEYLRQQSGTSISGNRGEFYNFKLF